MDNNHSTKSLNQQQLLDVLLYAYRLGENNKEVTTKKMIKALTSKLNEFYK